MPFTASNGLTEATSGKSIAAGGMNVHYHEVGDGEPVLFLHSYGPGTTAWITFHKALGELSRHYRCILMDLPNFSKTGPIIYREGVHGLQARTAVALLDALGPMPRASREAELLELKAQAHSAYASAVPERTPPCRASPAETRRSGRTASHPLRNPPETPLGRCCHTDPAKHRPSSGITEKG